MVRCTPLAQSIGDRHDLPGRAHDLPTRFEATRRRIRRSHWARMPPTGQPSPTSERSSRMNCQRGTFDVQRRPNSEEPSTGSMQTSTGALGGKNITMSERCWMGKRERENPRACRWCAMMPCGPVDDEYSVSASDVTRAEISSRCLSAWPECCSGAGQGPHRHRARDTHGTKDIGRLRALVPEARKWVDAASRFQRRVSMVFEVADPGLIPLPP